MNHQLLVAEFLATPWALMPERLNALAAVVMRWSAGIPAESENMIRIQADRVIRESRRQTAAVQSSGGIAVLPGHCPTGRTNTRIRGWLGRADQTTKIRGMFVHPGQVAEVARRHPGVGRVRLVVEGTIGDERMVLHAETASPSTQLAEQMVASVRDVTKLRGEVQLAAPGTLAADGKVIDDQRSYK